MTTARPRRARPENELVTLFRIPLFRRMWAAITFSSFGDWLGLLATTALAQQLTVEADLRHAGRRDLRRAARPPRARPGVRAVRRRARRQDRPPPHGDHRRGHRRRALRLDRGRLQPRLALHRAVRHRGGRAVHPAGQAGRLDLGDAQAPAGHGQPDLAHLRLRQRARRRGRVRAAVGRQPHHRRVLLERLRARQRRHRHRALPGLGELPRQRVHGVPQPTSDLGGTR